MDGILDFDSVQPDSDPSQTEPDTRLPGLDTVLDVCRDRHRRIVLATLATGHQPVSITDLTNAVVEHTRQDSVTETADETAKRVRIRLDQVHLPKMAAAGLLDYDRELKMATATAHVGRDDTHLSAILAMDDDLPTAQ